MKSLIRYITLFSVVTALVVLTSGASLHFSAFPETGKDTVITGDTTAKLPFPFRDRSEIPFEKEQPSSPLYLKDPQNVTDEIEYNPENNQYEFRSKIGNLNYRTPYSMDYNDFRKYNFEKAERTYWRQRFKSESFQHQTSLIPQLHVGGEIFETIFGSNTIDIKPQGSAELTFGLNYQKTANPTLPEQLQKTTNFDFKEKIQMNVTGKIGENLEMQVNYNTEATFEFENKMKLRFEGKEDDIIQRIEAGNVSLPLTGSLITGSQSLFGILTELKFGKLRVTTVLSQQESETQVIEVQGGAQKNNFDVEIDKYDANRHFFIGHFFKDVYDTAMSTLPVINSAVNINKIEVWITNRSNTTENTRNIIAFTDLAEGYSFAGGTNISNPRWTANAGFYPYDSLNTLYQTITSQTGVRNINQTTQILSNSLGLASGKDYDKLENARKLAPTEYRLNQKLGYISLNNALTADEVLAVAFEYTAGGKTFKVGELSTDGVAAPECLIVKLLKPTSLTPSQPTWDLMMKNIYSINAYQVNPENFVLDILYKSDSAGNVYKLNEGAVKGVSLLRVMQFDRLNMQQQPVPNGDGVFDFIEGYTIVPSNGRIIFPVREPFGRYLYKKILGNNPRDSLVAKKYAFPELYDSTLTVARQITSKNKFVLQGQYMSAGGSEIMLNAPNIPQGSVKVIAGGVILNENTDYMVDYTMGKVTILNKGLLESGTPIKISLESNSMFSIQSKRMAGVHLDYKLNDDFVLGATVLNLNEKPLTQKVNIGDEPISNTIYGFNGSYKHDVPFLTKMVDYIPFIETKEMSNILFSGEYAYLRPGHSKALTEKGESYIDDFESSKSEINIQERSGWSLASVPQGQPQLFPNAGTINDIRYGFGRAKFTWYTIEPSLYESGSPVSSSQRKSLYVMRWNQNDLFNKQLQSQVQNYLTTLDLGFYPRERGPYNYDTTHIDPATGSFSNPKNRWGGMMRKISTNDFELANIEYLEFYMLDPYLEDADSGIVRNDDDPALYINLGDISEDILRDGRKSFENGLPNSSNVTLVDTTSWGRVSRKQFISPGFDNESGARTYQDVGFDGLGGEDEKNFFHEKYNFPNSLQGKVPQQIYDQLVNDPSSDNFHFFKGGDYDDQGLNILDRYKQFSNPDGNSAVGTQTVQSATSIPDIEDINNDNTLNETEAYFQYKIPLRPEDLNIDNKYIVNIITKNIKINNETKEVRWYHVKIPIYSPDRVYGGIEDFRSVRFMRLFMYGFDNRVIVRMAKFALVRGEWRKYNLVMKDESESLVEDNDLSASPFDVSSVNIEEDSRRTPIHYMLPPGITRERDISTQQEILKNEQSLALRVDSLNDGFSKAVFRNVRIDCRQYKRLKMEVHAEARHDETALRDNDLHIFIRLGSDNQDNYYEYEIPLQVSPWGNHSPNSVWPSENRFDFAFEELLALKQQRNDAMRMQGTNVRMNTVYAQSTGNNIIRIKGNPNLADVRSLMIGIRNPKQPFGDAADDGRSKSAEIWVNELRLSDFVEDGGWAANARVSAKLADFATINVTGSTVQPGFGSIEKKVSERSKAEIYQYDASGNVELGKFFPEKARVKIPMYAGYSESFSNPQYNPVDPDIPLKVTLNNPNLDEGEKRDIKHKVQDYTRRRALNFTNIGIQPQGETHFYSISNWSASYSYNEVFSRNINTEYNTLRNYSGSINYIFNSNPKPVIPFKSIKVINKIGLIRDFNFFYAPRQLGFRTNMNRKYNEVLLRNLYNTNQSFEPTFNKEWMWKREYDLKYDITRALKFEFAADNDARIDEPYGRIDREDESYEARRDSIMREIKGLGTTTGYEHRFSLTYTPPINKIKFLSWVSANLRYGGTYNWEKGPEPTLGHDLGNTIKNSNNKSLTTTFTLQGLYSKVKYFDRLDKKYKKPAKQRQAQKQTETVTYTKSGISLKANEPRIILHNLGTEDIQVKAMIDSTQIQIKFNLVNENRITIIADKNYENVNIIVTGKREVTENPVIIVFERTLLFLMGVKNISITVNETNGSILPGYMRNTEYLGSVFSEDAMAPGWAFISGIQDRDFPIEAIRNGWLSKDPALNTPFAMTYSENISIRSSIEPLPGFKIDVTGTRTYGKRYSEFYIIDSTGDFHTGPDGLYSPQSQQVSGNFNISFFSLRTAFDKIDKNEQSEAFLRMSNYRYEIARRLEREHFGQNLEPDPETGFPSGYGPTSQQVIIPAFIAAYTKTSPSRVSLETFPSYLAIKPNWRITYDGLGKIETVKKYARSVNMSHGYLSTFSIGSFISNNRFADPNGDGFSEVRDRVNNFIPAYDISNITINEQFSPLIAADVTWVNSMTTRFEIKRSRNLAFSMANNQLNESRNTEFVIGAGYRFNQIKVKIGNTNAQSDLNVRLDFSIRDNVTFTRRLVEEIDQPASGSRTTALKSSADYQVSDNFTLRVFFDYNLDNPRLSTAYRTTKANFGFSLRFQLTG